MADGTCELEGCTAPVWCRGRCANHDQQRRQTVIWTCRTFGCSNLVRSTGRRSVFTPCCSPACRRMARIYRERLRSRPVTAHQDPTRRVCNECGVDAGSYKGSSSYGQIRCSDCTVEYRRSLNRRKNQRRRGYRGYGRYTLAEIGDRDGWRCHLCGGKVNPRVQGPGGLAPSVDHLVPLSAGGSDDRANVAVAHADCNARRRTGGEVQLRLVG